MSRLGAEVYSEVPFSQVGSQGGNRGGAGGHEAAGLDFDVPLVKP